MKKFLKYLLQKSGYVIVRKDHFYKLVEKTKAGKKTSHTIHLDNLMKLLHNIGFQPNYIFDIGAHKGDWTRNALEYFPNADYVLFEPQHNLSEHIKKIFKNNDGVKVFACGVSNEKSVLNFTLHEREDSCTFRMSPEEAASRGFKQVQIPVVRLDDFIRDENLPFPDILKIDAEGIDLKVIEGAEFTIKNHAEIVLVEVAIMNPYIENKAYKVINIMDDLGFKLFDITDLNRPLNQKVLWLSEFVFIRKNGVLDKIYS